MTEFIERFSFTVDNEPFALALKSLFIVIIFVLGFRFSRDEIYNSIGDIKKNTPIPTLTQNSNLKEYRAKKRYYKIKIFFLRIMVYVGVLSRITLLIFALSFGSYFGGILMAIIGKAIADPIMYLGAIIFKQELKNEKFFYISREM